MKVVLSHPYAGALQWWLQSSKPGSQMPKIVQHPYYQTLFGDVDKYLDVALACVVIFEDVVIAGADNYYPIEIYPEPRGVIPDVDIHVDMEATSLGYSMGWDALDDAANHPEVIKVLKDVPANSRSQLVHEAITDAQMMLYHNAPLISSQIRRLLIKTLAEIRALPTPDESRLELSTAGEVLRSEVDSYSTVTGLTFRQPNLGSLARIKNHSDIRKYASLFQRVMTEKATSVNELYEAIADAWAKRELAEDIAAGFSTASKGFSIAGLIPGVGTVTELIALGADAGAIAAERDVKQNSWYELSPQIMRLQSLDALEQHLRGNGLR